MTLYLKHKNSGNCIFTKNIPKNKVIHMPVAHGEGRFLFAKEKEKIFLKKLYDNDQLVFRYCSNDGEYSNGEFPVNPNGAFHDIAGICNSQGTVFGLMPHPERAFYGCYIIWRFTKFYDNWEGLDNKEKYILWSIDIYLAGKYIDLFQYI